MIPWARGRCLECDATVVDTLAPSHISESATSAGAAAAKAEVIKIHKYTDIAITHNFIPLAFETLGVWGRQCDAFIRELDRRLSVVTGEKKEIAFLKQRLSIAIQRGNALACLGTIPKELDNEHI